jgi:hypothetical protein
MQRKNRVTSYFNTIFLIIGIVFLLYSAWNLFVNNKYIPYMTFFPGSVFITAMFGSLILARFNGRTSMVWSIIAILNTLLLIFLYLNPIHLKELYPIAIWIFLVILIASLQQVLDRMKKRYHQTVRIFNYGLIVALIPLYLLKSEAPFVWNIFSWICLLIMLSNLIIFLLPTRHGTHSR